MQVTINHREESTGLTGRHRNYFVDCDVLFSEEERATIVARAMQQHSFEVTSARPPRSRSHYIGAGFLRGLSPVVGVVGIVLAFFSGIGGLLIFLAIVMFVAGFVMDRRPAGEAKPQHVTLGRLVTNPRLTVYAYDPADAARIDDELRETLANIKNRLIINTEVRAKEPFEL
ncbi:MAG TPA: hypothetical protein VGW96_02645 [Candidatus Eremiobacteraceae bacterium]|nr:hypothetical protein [Candidatus Eremiobacteraceae bacterium]